MSGHSKWATTKRAKAVVDARRATVFTRLANAITLAAREKGGDATINFSLRLAIEKGRESNMPKENIERAIKRGTGDGDVAQLEEIIYEGYGPGGVALLVHTLTDNRNRTVSEVKHIFSSHGGNLGSANSVAWMFEKQGVIGISQHPTEEQELALIECGVNDIQKEGDEITLMTNPHDLQKAKICIEQCGIPLVFAEFDYRATTHISLCPADKERLDALCSGLDELSDVTDYYSNSK